MSLLSQRRIISKILRSSILVNFRLSSFMFELKLYARIISSQYELELNNQITSIKAILLTEISNRIKSELKLDFRTEWEMQKWCGFSDGMGHAGMVRIFGRKESVMQEWCEFLDGRNRSCRNGANFPTEWVMQEWCGFSDGMGHAGMVRIFGRNGSWMNGADFRTEWVMDEWSGAVFGRNGSWMNGADFRTEWVMDEWWGFSCEEWVMDEWWRFVRGMGHGALQCCNFKVASCHPLLSEVRDHFSENRSIPSIVAYLGAQAKCLKFGRTQLSSLSLSQAKRPAVAKAYSDVANQFLCKTMERIIHTRFMKCLIEKEILQFYQTSYRAKHSKVDQLFYLCQSIIDGFQEKPSKKTTVVFLDLSAAFDRVWRQQKLIEIIHREGLSSESSPLPPLHEYLRPLHRQRSKCGMLCRRRGSLAHSPGHSTLTKNSKPVHGGLDRSGAGIILTYANDKYESHKISLGKIVSNYTCELVAIKEALNLYYTKAIQNSNELLLFSDSRSVLQAILRGNSQLTQDIILFLNEITKAQRTCILQWISAHVDIKGNEKVDILAKEARENPQPSYSLTVTDANVIASLRLLPASIQKHSIPALNCDHIISTTIARLRTKHVREMKISSDGHRNYRSCPHCIDTELSPDHIFDCPAILAKLFKIHLDSPHQLLYSSEIIDVAKAVIDTFGQI
ncbi:hypothetical protein HNY73_001004 [Argiope bruennichi]|uniref:RNase H type-1 domain-containing protein n=1 Tax=Argiope bruennichi TaxID=94029 RepID=A0A8T0G2D0_ARGBR|nr:hypothetical protein HNY73_001004 [Argiope bruennichi]